MQINKGLKVGESGLFEWVTVFFWVCIFLHGISEDGDRSCVPTVCVPRFFWMQDRKLRVSLIIEKKFK